MSATVFESNQQIVPAEPRPAAVAVTPAVVLDRMLERGQNIQDAMEFFEKWESRIAAENYGHALAAFQAQCPQIVKRRQIDLGGGKGPLFASLDDIHEVIKPILAANGLAVRYSAEMTDSGQMRATCFIRHGRHEEASEVTLPVPTQMRVNDCQKMGAALSYAKRYALCAALNIVVTDEDNDAATVMETITEEQMAQLEEWIEVSGADRVRFLKRFAIEKLADMPATQFLVAIGELKRKAAQKK